ncbi:hypothetical protein ABIB48_003030 [Arthrobacter sp. UYCu511]|uniref:reverse transcriptase domain-containing protein n=1 Tax=Arthrobacter sp. UYCu511 TaxID=3156337 RepID=UPI0033915789
MMKSTANKYTLEQLALAYRKAKVDLHYSNDSRSFDLLHYETELDKNLTSLLKRLNSNDTSWVDEPKYLGMYGIIPKTLRETPTNTNSNNTMHVSPDEAWESQKNSQKNNLKAEFRLISRCSIDMHVISALWIGGVGSILDAELPEENVKGHRLRRKHNNEYNWYSSGSYQPYLIPYRNWQNDGFNAMIKSLEADERIITVTADATDFFPSISPEFLENDDFFDTIDINKDEIDQKLHAIFVKSLTSWRRHMGSLLGQEVSGLPLGLPASALVANLAMTGFDRAIRETIRPYYYGRYVDDIIIVMPSVQDFKTGNDVWNWMAGLFNHAPGTVDNTENGNADASPRVELSNVGEKWVFCASYLGSDSISFGNEKNRVLFMHGETGRSLMQSLQTTIAERSSEWRSLPILPEDPKDIGSNIARALRRDGVPADSLRSTERVTASRAMFALTLRDFEAYARDLDPNSWQSHRRAFYQSVRNHILTPQTALDMDVYIHRILKLAIHCSDWDEFLSLVERLLHVYNEIIENCSFSVKSLAESAVLPSLVETSWGERMYLIVKESVLTTAPGEIPAAYKDHVDKSLDSFSKRLSTIDQNYSISSSSYRLFFWHDLAYTPFRMALFPHEINPFGSGFGIDVDSEVITRISDELLPADLVDALKTLLKAIEGFSQIATVPPAVLPQCPALLFPTRPLSSMEVFSLTKFLSPVGSLKDDTNECDTAGDISNWMFATRGYTLNNRDLPGIVKSGEDDQFTFEIPNTLANTPHLRSSHDIPKPRIAVTMLKIEEQSWLSSLHNKPNLSRDRLYRVAHLINEILAKPTRPDYIVFPEVALPASWFIGIAKKLTSLGISFISGVEYIHADGGFVHNQIWASFVTDIFGFRSSVLYSQDKQHPAPNERIDLQTRPAHPLSLRPRTKWDKPPLIKHGPHWLAFLICSELTNIEYRASLRGKVDFLIVPEWNRDLNTFNALIESAALDMHAFVIQVNNRMYGDSRVRAPMAKDYQRDIARVRGGLNDYFVLAEIDTAALRTFQAQVGPIPGQFKPLPDGFKLDPRRRTTPKL